MLREEVIKPRKIDRERPIVFALKKGGPLQLFVDYQNLNFVKIHDSYLLSIMDYCINSLGDTCIFSAVGSHSGIGNTKKMHKTAKKRLFKWPWSVLICMDVVWSKERLEHLPKGEVHHTFFSKTAINISTLGQHRRLFENRPWSSNSPLTSIRAS